jgi:elongator complex protein 3
MKKLSRTISGVTPVAVMAEPMGCPGHCVYCPTYPETPQSYTPNSPAVIRARRCQYDAAEQVRLRLRILADMGHPTDKVELIIMGGTFPAAPVSYQRRFVKDCFDALNGRDSASLEESQQWNEAVAYRCTGLCIETRPDFCGDEEIRRMLELGATRVEMGVQILDDEIYHLVKRGHTVADVISATRRLKENGFKVHYHWMPGLPGMTLERDLELFRMLFTDQSFRPDGLKIYPTMVVEGTELEKWYREGRYQPYDNKDAIELMAEMKALVPVYVRISRVLRDIPSSYIVGGLKESVRDTVKTRLKERGVACQCIRCREYGHRLRKGRKIGEPKLMRTDYQASGGQEIFLSLEDDGATLFGLLRLRIQAKPLAGFENNGNGRTAIIRELHIYGPEVPLSQQQSGAAQHRGLGKQLMREAERICRTEFGVAEIAVLSGVGAREYYRAEFGYSLHKCYMVKSL